MAISKISRKKSKIKRRTRRGKVGGDMRSYLSSFLTRSTSSKPSDTLSRDEWDKKVKDASVEQNPEKVYLTSQGSLKGNVSNLHDRINAWNKAELDKRGCGDYKFWKELIDEAKIEGEKKCQQPSAQSIEAAKRIQALARERKTRKNTMVDKLFSTPPETPGTTYVQKPKTSSFSDEIARVAAARDKKRYSAARNIQAAWHKAVARDDWRQPIPPGSEAAKFGKQLEAPLRDVINQNKVSPDDSISRVGDDDNVADLSDFNDDDPKDPSNPKEIARINQENAMICEYHKQGKPWNHILRSGREPGGDSTSRPVNWKPDFTNMCNNWDGGKGRKSQKKKHKNLKSKSQKKKPKNSKRKSRR